MINFFQAARILLALKFFEKKIFSNFSIQFQTMIQLKNEQLCIQIHPKGAELQSIFHRQHRLEYLWNGNPEYWGKHAPVLFPIVGQLKNNSYSYQDKNYSLPRHGFARDLVFDLVQSDETAVTFELKSNESTLQAYPFHFSFQIKYTVIGNQLINEYLVQNTGDELMLFSVGGHPAFKVPLLEGSNYTDYYLALEQEETLARWPLQDGLLKTHAEPFLKEQKIIPLSHQLFANDAVVLKQLQSTFISLKSHRTRHGLTMHFEGFPYFGIWAAKEAPFVCLEPWCGIADSLYHDGALANKEGIIQLGTQETWKKSWRVEVF